MNSTMLQFIIDNALQGKYDDNYIVEIWLDAKNNKKNPSYYIIENTHVDEYLHSGELSFHGWSHDHCEGYQLVHYFHEKEGYWKYCGPDMFGCYPILRIA